MPSYKRFEDLEIWQRAREICAEADKIYVQSGLKKDFALWNQLNGSSGSVMDNIAEGFGRGGNKEFIQFLSIAKASCDEAKSQLYRCYDRNYLNKENFEKLSSDMDICKAQIGGFMNYLRNSERKGAKYDPK